MPKQQNVANFCFFFPYHEDSGVPVLFYRMANYIASQYPDAKIYAIDYVNGAIARHLLKLPNLQLLAFEDGKEIVPPENAVLVTQSIVPYYWPSELKPRPNTKLLIWNLHPQNFVPSLIPFGKYRDITINNFVLHKLLSVLFKGLIKQIANYVELLSAHKALLYMDQTNRDFTKKYLFLKKTSDFFLPVPLTQSEKLNKRTEINPKKINFCWIGRLCDFKAPILVYTSQKLAALSVEMDINIVYHIVGDGPFKQYIENRVNNNNNNNNFKMVYHGSIPNLKLDEFLLNEIDIVTGMGTSALEGAKLGIPNIKLDISYKPIVKDYNYGFIYNTVNYDLGHYISSSDFIKNNESLKNIILAIINDYSSEAKKCYQYFIKNHSIETVVNNFIVLANGSDLTYKMIPPQYFEQPPILKRLNRLRQIN